jgi:hypothetical protein
MERHELGCEMVFLNSDNQELSVFLIRAASRCFVTLESVQ